MQVMYNSVKESIEITVSSQDMVRLLQSLVNLLGLKIINSRIIDLANINTVVDGSPDL